MKTGTPRVQLSCVTAILGLFGLPWAVYGQLQAQGNCTGAGASASISRVEWSAGILDADGSWNAWGIGASGVWLEYSIDGTPVQGEDRNGTGGSWAFLDNFSGTGTHTLSVKACPKVTSGGVTTTCLTHCSTTQSIFPRTPEVSVWCNQVSSTTMICTGNLDVSSQSPYNCYWKEGSGSWYSVSCWENSYTCKSITPPFTVSFKVIDANGTESNVALSGCPAPLN